MVSMCWVKDFFDEETKQECVEYYCQKNNDRRVQFKCLDAPTCPGSLSKCVTCARPDCADETRIVNLGTHLGKRLGVFGDCPGYEARKCK